MADGPGAAYAKSEEARRLKAGRALVVLTERMTGSFGHGWYLKGLSIRAPRDETEDFLITARGLDHEGQPVVAFSGGMSLEDAFVTFLSRLDNGTLKWREDTFGR